MERAEENEKRKIRMTPDPHPDTPEPKLAQMKSRDEENGDPPRAKVSPEAKEPPAVDDDNSCEKRDSGGKSELISGEEMKKCKEWKEVKKWFGFC